MNIIRAIKEYLHGLKYGFKTELSLEEADQAPNWTQLWVVGKHVENFNTAATWKHQKPSVYNESPLFAEVDMTNQVIKQYADLVIAVPNPHLTIVLSSETTQHITIYGDGTPQCLSREAPRHFVLLSPQFRRLWSLGYFQIITSKEAERLLDNVWIKDAVERRKKRIRNANPNKND